MPKKTELFESLIGSLCEIKTDQNELLLIARVSSLGPDDDRINFVSAQPGDRMPLLPYNKSVKIICFSGVSGFMLMRGTVYISSDDNLSLVDVNMSQGYERRRYFRLNTNTPAEAVMQNSAEEDAPFYISLLDISLGGIRVGSKKKLVPNDMFLVTFALLDRKMEFCCRVCREIPDSFDKKTGTTQYGCEFVNFTSRQLDQLCGIMFKIQRLEIQKRKQNEYERI